MPSRWIFALPFGAIFVAFGSMLAIQAGGAAPTAMTSLWAGVFNLMALGFAIAASLGPHAGPNSRRAWALLAGAFALLIACGVVFAVGFSDEVLSRREAMLGYGLRMVTVPAMLIGVFILPRHPWTGRQRNRLVIDMVIVIFGGLMLMWYFLIGPALDRGVTGESWVSVLYPLSDLTLIFGIGAVLMRGVAASRRPLLFLIGALFCYLLLDIMSVQTLLRMELNDIRVWLFGDYLVVGATFLMASAAAAGATNAWVPLAAAGTRRSRWPGWLGATQSPPSAGRPVTLLPYLALAVGYLALVLSALGDGLEQSDALVGGAIALTGAVVLRQVLAMRESHRLVITDSLTGLANRRQLRDNLDRAIEHGRRTDTSVAVLLIDLDGFKAINDELGHEAGDAVLVHFGALLAGLVRHSDTAARLGGDEFAVVAPGVSAEEAGWLAQRVLDAAALPVEVGGQLLPIRTSIGVAVSGPDAAEARELLHRADLAMYRAKRQQTHTWQLYVDAEPTPQVADPVAPIG